MGFFKGALTIRAFSIFSPAIVVENIRRMYPGIYIYPGSREYTLDVPGYTRVSPR